MSAATDNPPALDDTTNKELATTRDTVHSIGIAVVLAFVLRAFLIEAFVIPTGSMAPRLMGEHWRLICPVCTYEYDYGWPERTPPARGRKVLPPNARCPSCNHEYDASAGQPTWVDGGDRVLVLKYLDNFRDLQPWDVVVFRNPQNNRENYIKRLVGLPGETIEIIHGDVWVRASDDAPWAIRRKPPAVQQVMWQIIHDNDYQPRSPDAQSAEPLAGVRIDYDIIPKWIDPRATGLWDQAGDHGRRFVFAGGGSAGLRFFGPRRGAADGRPAFLPHYGYNNLNAEKSPHSNTYFTDEVCTDLKLSFVYTPAADDSRIALLMDVFARGYAAEVSADGTVRLLHRAAPAESVLGADPAELTEATGWATWQRAQIDPLKPGKGYEIALTNADHRLTLWIDGRAVLESTDTQYPADREEIRTLMESVFARNSSARIPTPQVAIAAGGGPCELLHLKLQRDVYYTYTRLEVPPQAPQWAYARSLPGGARPATGDPGWGVMGQPIRLQGSQSSPNDLDSFYVLGDNSPQSLDSRRWTQAAPTLRLRKDGRPVYQLGTVPRYNLIGKAVFVYWPSGFRLPGPAKLPWLGLPGPASLPLIPNVGSMRMVR